MSSGVAGIYRRLIDAGERHDLGIFYGPLVCGGAGECHGLAVDVHGIGDPIRPRHKARAFCDGRFHGQGDALHVVSSAAGRKLLYKGVDQLLLRHRRPIVRRTGLISLDADDAEVAFRKQIQIRLTKLRRLPVRARRLDLIQPPRPRQLLPGRKAAQHQYHGYPQHKLFDQRNVPPHALDPDKTQETEFLAVFELIRISPVQGF